VLPWTKLWGWGPPLLPHGPCAVAAVRGTAVTVWWGPTPDTVGVSACGPDEIAEICRQARTGEWPKRTGRLLAALDEAYRRAWAVPVWALTDERSLAVWQTDWSTANAIGALERPRAGYLL